MSVNNFKNEKGFTIIELLIYIAISSVVITVVVSYFFRLNESYAAAKNSNVVNNSESFLINKLENELSYVESLDSANCIFNNDNGKIVINNSGNVISYYLINNQIVKTANGGEPVSLTDSDIEIKKFNISKMQSPNNLIILSFLINFENESDIYTSKRELSFEIFLRPKNLVK